MQGKLRCGLRLVRALPDAHADVAGDGPAPELDGSGDGAVSRVDAGTAPEELARMIELCHAWRYIVCGAQ